MEACWQLLRLYGGNWDALVRSQHLAEVPVLSPLLGLLVQLGMIAPPMLAHIQQMRLDQEPSAT